jgi:hypothetical protein
VGQGVLAGQRVVHQVAELVGVAKSFYDGGARETFGSAGFLYCRFANLRTAVTPAFGDVRVMAFIT